MKITGSALLKNDNLSGEHYWITWDGEGKHEVIYTVGEPLVFPPAVLQRGTRVLLLPPEKKHG